MGIKILLATKRIVQLDIKANMQVTRGSMKSNAVLKKTTSVATARVMVSSGVLNTRSVSNTNQRVNQRVFTGSLGLGLRQAVGSSTKHDWRVNAVIQDGAKLDRPLRVAIVGGGPAGACAAEECAKAGCETFMIERKMDNCKPCGGAIPLCMIDEFDLPSEIIDRKVNRMKMISPSNREVDIGETLAPNEYIGMTRREILDDFLRVRAEKNGANVINGLFMGMEQREGEKGPWTMKVNKYSEDRKEKESMELEVDDVIGADGANSRVAKIIDAGSYDYAIAYQERIAIDEDKMKFYENLAEMYVGDDVSPDFYGWVFPKYDHVGVGTGTVINKPAIKKYQDAIRLRAGEKIEGGKIIKIEAHPIPEHY